MRDLLQFLERQLGRDALRGILNLAGTHQYFRELPPNNMLYDINASDYVAVLDGLEDYYDDRGAAAILRELGYHTARRAIIHSVGRAEQRGPISPKQLLILALEAFAKSTAIRERRFILLQDSAEILLVSVRRPGCWVLDRRGRGCQLVVGALKGSLELVSGRRLSVRPVACCEDNARHCIFEVARAGRP